MMRQKRPPLPPEKQREVDERFREIMRKSREEEEQKAREEFLPNREKVATCRCGGEIVVETTHHTEFDPSFGSPCIGVGNLTRGFIREECFCERCGALYKYDVVKK